MNQSKSDPRAAERQHFDRLVQETGEVWWGAMTAAGQERNRRRSRMVAALLAGYRDPAVFEMGCGTGAFTRYLLEDVPHLNVTGVDISPEAIARARERYGGKFPNARFEVGDATALPFEEATFDIVLGVAILHHLPLEAALRECLRILRPTGTLWFSEPNLLNPQVFLEKNVRAIGRRLQNTEDETAFVRWPLARLLRTIGFSDVSVRPFDFLHPAVPAPVLRVVDWLGRVVEHTPLLREIGGSLLITARKAESAESAGLAQSGGLAD